MDCERAMRVGVGALLALATALLPGHGEAAEWVTGACGPMRWQGNFDLPPLVELTRNPNAIRDGSTRYHRYWEAGDEWNAVPGMWPALWRRYRCRANCDIDVWDGMNMVSTFHRDVLDGPIGRTFRRDDGSAWRHPCYWVEADHMVAEDVRGLRPPRTSPGGNLPAIFIHEMGHVLGLEHEAGFTMMRARGGWPRVGGTSPGVGPEETVLPDDALGGRVLYPDGSGSNLLISSQALQWRDNPSPIGPRRMSAVREGQPQDSVHLCSGDTLAVDFAIGDTGDQSIRRTVRVELRSLAEPGLVVVLDAWPVDIDGGRIWLQYREIPLGGLIQPGRYGLWFVVEPVPGEARDSDNQAEASGTVWYCL